MENTEIDIQDFIRKFNRKYSYIGHNMSDNEIKLFLEQEHVKGRNVINQMDLLQDYMISNGLCEVQD